MLKRFWLFRFSAFLLCILCVHAKASDNVFVVYDNGKTIDLANYTSADKREGISSNKHFDQDQAADLVVNTFPLVSKIPQIQFDKYEIDQSLPTNFALVGVDLISQEWLKRNFEKIVNSGALVIVISAPDIDSYNHFYNVLRSAGLHVTKSESDPFIGLVKGYPALVVSGVVYQ